MSVERIPSIWDYLGQGAAAGGEAYAAGKQRNTQNTLQRLQLLSGLYGQGAIPAATLQGAMQGSGIPGMADATAIPSPNEQRNTLINNAPPDVQQTLKYSAAGLPDPADITLNRRVKEANVTKSEADATESQARAKLTTTQADEYVSSADTRRALTKLETNDKQAKVNGDIAQRYVAGMTTKAGGRIDTSKASDIALKAYQAYVADRQKSGMGTLDDPVDMKSYFDLAAQEAIIKQRSADATAAIAADRTKPEDRILQRLVQQEQNAAIEADKIMKDLGIGGQKYLDADPSTAPSIYQANIRQYQQIQGYRAKLRKAMSSLEPKDIQDILNDPRSQPQSTPPAGGPTTAAMTPDLFNQRVATMRQLDPATQQQYLDRNLKNGIITQADYAKMKAALGLK